VAVVEFFIKNFNLEMISFSPTKAYFANASLNLESFHLRIWEAASGNLITSFTGEPGITLTSHCWNGSSDTIALGLSNGENH
jgi:hypothetical protein